MTDRELMQQALEALEHLNRTGDTQVFDLCYAPELIPALKERLAQPEQEPVAFVDPIWMQRPDLIIEQRLEIKKLFARVQVMDYVPLYTAPQQEPVIDKSAAIRIATVLGWEPRREWVGLTDEEKKDALVSVDAETKRLPSGFRDFAQAIEAKLKEKNA